jgi:hypothetical protein
MQKQNKMLLFYLGIDSQQVVVRRSVFEIRSNAILLRGCCVSSCATKMTAKPERLK